MAANAQGINTAARSHPLFGIVDFIERKAQKSESDVGLNGRVAKLEDAVKSIADMQKELQFLIEKTREEAARSTTPFVKTHYQV